MESLERFTPIWKYLKPEYSEAKLKEIHLLLWHFGICVVGFEASAIPAYVETYLSNAPLNYGWLAQLLGQQHLLKKHPKKVKKAWLSSQRNLLIPNKLYEENLAEGWLRKFHHLNIDERLLTMKLRQPSMKSKIIFPIDDLIKAELEEHYPKVSFDTLSQMAFMPLDKNLSTQLNLVCLPKEIIFGLGHHQSFIYHAVHHYTESQDIIYKIALMLQEKGLTQEHLDQVKVMGIAPFWNELIQELAKFYITSPESGDSTQITLDFLSQLYQCGS